MTRHSKAKIFGKVKIMCCIESIALTNSIIKLEERIEELEKKPLAKLVKSRFGKNKKTVLAYDNRVEAIVVFFSKRLEKLEKDRTAEIEEAHNEGFDDAYEDMKYDPDPN